ncbi:MAG TPA: hypothetical protein DCS04_01910 [Ruminococcaceae bacterium]|nr:hypothetical protein [Oscillospiraceae bacterium]
MENPIKTKIYIAGKITGDPNYKDKFANMEAELLKTPETVVINPATLPEGLSPADYARICYAMIDSSDIAVFAPDYKESPGALLEMQYCKYIRKKTLNFEEYIQCQALQVSQLPLSAKIVNEYIDNIRADIAAANRTNFKIFGR